LLDERDARRAALKLGIKVLGTIGILTWAKKIGLLPSLQAELDSLQNEGKFRISVELYAKVLYEVNE
jgi:hypothetical protein